MTKFHIGPDTSPENSVHIAKKVVELLGPRKTTTGALIMESGAFSATCTPR